ncbi:MAG: TonB-dependent receptor [Candidatus Kapaibacteriota bacterium]
MKKIYNWSKSLCLCAALLLATSIVAFAQGVTTAGLSGSVTDATEYLKAMDDALAGKITMDAVVMKNIPSAKVLAIHLPSGTKYGTVARADGRYNLKGLQVGGPYQITVSSLGYKEEVQKNVFLGLGEIKRIDFALNQQDVTTKELVVTAVKDNRFTASRTGAGTEINTAQLNSVPTISRSFQDIVRTNPLTVSSNFDNNGDAGAISIAGQNNRYNNLQVDGSVINDIFGLSFSGAPSGQAGAQPISLDALQAVQVSIAPFDVRQSGFTGGLINSITRSGSNTVEGSVYSFFRNAALAGGSPDSLRTPLNTFSDILLGARVGGPIIQDKLFFFVNAETRTRTEPVTVGINDPRAANNFAVSADSLRRIIDIAKTQYGYDPGNFDTFNRTISDFKIFARIDWNIADNHRLTVRHSYVNARQDRGVDRSAINLALSNAKYVFSSVQNNTVLQLNSTFGSDASNEFRVSYMSVRDRRGEFAAGNFPYVQIGAAPGRTVILGVEQFSHGNYLNQDNIEITNDFSLFIGAHTLTIGTHNEFFSSENLFFPWSFGSYSYGSISDFANGTPFGYINRFVTNPTQYGERPVTPFRSMQFSLYAQDDWDISPNFRVTGGIRGDIYLFPLTPFANPIAAQAFPGYRTDRVPAPSLLLSPRIGFNWDVSGGSRVMQVRGGTGIFAGRTPIVWLSNQYSNTGVDVATNFIFNGSVTRARYPQQFMNQSNPPARQQGLQPGQYPATVNFVDDNFRIPQTWRSSIGLDRQLVGGFSATAEFVFSQLLTSPTYKNLRLGTSKFNDFLGRPVYNYDGGGMTASTLNYAFLLTSVQAGFQTNFTIQLEKRAGDGGDVEAEWYKNLGVNLSYTNGSSWDVNSNPAFIADENFNVPAADPNNLPLTRSSFDLPHRILAILNYRFEYGASENGTFATSIGLIYEGRTGRPFSYVYNGDVNNDQQVIYPTNNDLLFVPKDRSQVSMSDAEWTAFDRYITNDALLSQYRGKVMPRNDAREPWLNQLDLQLTQDIPTFKGQKIQISLNITNVLNLLNPDWGWQYFVPLPPGDFSGQSRYALVDYKGLEPDGRPKLGFRSPTTDARTGVSDIFQRDFILSRWQMQIGLRYSF